MFDTLFQLFILFLYQFFLTFITVFWDAGKFILQNLKIFFILFLIFAVIIVIYIIINIFKSVLVVLGFYFDEIRIFFKNNIGIVVLNGIRPIKGLLAPILGTVNEVFLAMLIAFSEHFCPERDLGQCLQPERFVFFVVDMASGAAILIELIVIQISIYQTLIMQFICDLAIYNPALESFFCSFVPQKKAYIEQIIANETFVYIDQQAYDHIEVVMAAIAGFLRLMVREGLDYFGRTLIFLSAEFLIILKYFLILGVVVTAFILSVITGIIYTSFPPGSRSEFNVTVSFTDAYDIMQTRLVEQLLIIDPLKFYRESDFPCPPGVCELFESILIWTNSTAHNVYQNIPIIFMWTDIFLCGITNLHSCGGDFGICEFFFDLQNGVLQVGIENLFHAIISSIDEVCIPDLDICLGDLGLGTIVVAAINSLFGIPCAIRTLAGEFEDIYECYADAVLFLPQAICEGVTAVGECPCWVCEIDEETQELMFDMFNYLPIPKNGRVPCNPFGDGLEACCISGNDYTYYDGNCIEQTASGYTSIFYFIYQLIFTGEALEYLTRKPLRCKEPVGYGYGFLDSDVIPYYRNYFFLEFPTRVWRNSHLFFNFLNPELLERFESVITWPFFAISSPSYEYLFSTWELYDSNDVDVDSEIYENYKRFVYTLTIGCYGPNFIAYYYTDLFEKDFTYVNFNINPYGDTDFETAIEVLTGLLDLKSPPFYGANGIRGLNRFLNFPLLQSLYLCPTNMKIHEYAVGPILSEIRIGSHHQFLITNSMVKELREQYYSSTINGVFDLLNIPILNYKKREKFENSYPFKIKINEIRPTTFLSLIENEEWYLMSKFEDLDIIITNKSDILNYEINTYGFWTFAESGGMCRVYSIDPGDDNENPQYLITSNELYVDMGRSSYFNYYLPEVHNDINIFILDDPWKADDIVLLEHCTRFLDCFFNNSCLPTLNTSYTWEKFDEQFIDKNIRSDIITNNFLNYWEGTREIVQDYHFIFSFEDDFLEELTKQFLVIKVMREKYFTLKIMDYVFDEFIDLDPCDTGFSNISFFNISNFDSGDCNDEFDYVKLFLRYYIKHDALGWYPFFFDNSLHPINICERVISVLEVVYEIDDYLEKATNISRYTEGTDEFNYAANLVWNYIKLLNSKTLREIFNEMGYDIDEAIKFCGNDGVQEPRMGQELPKTECLLYMQALNSSSLYDIYIDSFFDPKNTTCDVIESFLTNVFDYGFKKKNGNSFSNEELSSLVLNLDNYLNCFELIFDRVPIQSSNTFNITCF